MSGLTVVAAEPEGNARALDELAAWFLRYAQLTAPDRPDGIWIDATGCAHLFGGEATLLADIVERLARCGIACRAAIADTPGEARAVARYGKAAVTVVPAGETPATRHPLPMAAFRLPDEMVAALARLGFERLDQFLAAPRAPLTLRFGPELVRRLDQALGRVFEPIAIRSRRRTRSPPPPNWARPDRPCRRRYRGWTQSSPNG